MPAEFQKAINRTINYAKNLFCFLDDILIKSKGSEQEHKKLALTILEKLDEENLALKLSKCKFFQTEVNWLGHKLSPEGITPKITKTEAILQLSPPKSRKTTQILYGAA